MYTYKICIILLVTYTLKLGLGGGGYKFLSFNIRITLWCSLFVCMSSTIILAGSVKWSVIIGFRLAYFQQGFRIPIPWFYLLSKLSHFSAKPRRSPQFLNLLKHLNSFEEVKILTFLAYKLLELIFLRIKMNIISFFQT